MKVAMGLTDLRAKALFLNHKRISHKMSTDKRIKIISFFSEYGAK